jgi:PAS domain S-box-containing protein
MTCALSHILLVDAHDGARQRLTSVLEGSAGRKYRVSVVGSLCDALSFLSKTQVDVVLLDMKLPDVSGLSAFYQIAAAHPKLPIIILTLMSDKRAAKAAIRAGAQDYLIKRDLNGVLLRRSMRYAVARKRAEWDYKTEHERFRGIYESSKDAIGYMRGDGSPLDVNDAFCTLTGYVRQELLGMSCYQSLTPSKHHRMEKNIMHIVSVTGAPAEYEKELVCKDGKVVPVMVTMFVVRNACGVVDGLAVIIKDITERKKVDKLKDDFIISVSHELRTPLTVAHAAVENLRDRVLGEISEKQMEVVHHIHQNLQHLSVMINDLLDLSRLESGKHKMKRTATNMMELVDKAVRNFQGYASQAQVTLSCELPKQLSILDVDPEMISRVLYNLLDNAIRFARGRVWVGVSKMGKGTHDGLCISICDDGTGIPQTEMGRLFSKFEQVGRPVWERGHKGTGLGLAISRGIMQQHQGKIWVENLKEGGAVFHVMLPPNDSVGETTQSSLAVHVAECDDEGIGKTRQ